MENIHRVSSHGAPEGRLLSLGEHGTFVSCYCFVCVCVGGVGTYGFCELLVCRDFLSSAVQAF